MATTDKNGLAQLNELLTEFCDLFQQPTGLPPICNYDHRINLMPDSGPMVVRPYRYAHLQKNEIEK